MSEIKLADGTTLHCEGVFGSSVTYLGVSRDALTFTFAPEEMGLEELMGVFTPENCAAVTITEEEGAAFVHEHYTIRIGAGVSCRDMARRGMSGGPIQDNADAVWVTMAQATPTERMLEALMGQNHGG